MKLSFANTCLLICISSLAIIFITHYYQYVEAKRRDALPDESMMAPEFDPMSVITLTEGEKAGIIKLKNRAYYWLSECQAYAFPRGLHVRISPDRSTCEILGMPREPQTIAESLVIATNRKGEKAEVKIFIIVNPKSDPESNSESNPESSE